MADKKCCLWKCLMWICVALACLFTIWVFIHRRLIRALIKNEPVPACPHRLPSLAKKLLSEK